MKIKRTRKNRNFTCFFSYTFASYCFSRSSDSSDRITSPIYSITIVCFSKSRAAYKPSPWIFDLWKIKSIVKKLQILSCGSLIFIVCASEQHPYLAKNTLLRHSCFIFLYCELFEWTNCLLYGHATSPTTDVDATNVGRWLALPDRWVCGFFQLRFCCGFGSVLAAPDGLIANGSSSNGFRPYLNR